MIGLIWAQARGGVIGRDGDIPWDIPEDLVRFAGITQGKTVVMGRRTWDSLPAHYRPLPGRRNIVLTRDPEWSEPGAEAVQSLDAALALAGDSDVWVIGGAELYAQTIDLADVLEITVVDEYIAGDTVAPHIGNGWALDAGAGEPQVSGAGLRYRFNRYTRRN